MVDLLSRDAILGAMRREIITVEAPSLGGSVAMRALTGVEAAEIYAAHQDQTAITQAIVARSICDAQGNRLFGIEDAPALFDKPFGAMSVLTSAALRINCLTKEGDAAARKD